MTLTAISVTHNSAAVIREALACVHVHPAVERCIVADNASDDATVSDIRQNFPHTHIITNDTNRGFGVACNQALEQVETPFALLINPDAAIDAKGIDRLLDVLHTCPNAAMAAPAFDEQGEDASTHSLRFPLIRPGNAPLRVAVADGVDSVQFLSGALVCLRMEHMKRVGFFDPAIFLFYEDDDLCIRTARAGFDMLLVSGIQAQHQAGHSCKPSQQLEDRKYASSQWSYYYIHRKFRGGLVAWIMAVQAFMKARLVYLINHMVCWPYLQDAEQYYDIVQKRHEKKWPDTARTYPKEEAIRRHEGEWIRITRRLSDKANQQRELKRKSAAACHFLKHPNNFRADG